MTRDRLSSSTVISKRTMYVVVSLAPPPTMEEEAISVKVYFVHFIYEGKRHIK